MPTPRWSVDAAAAWARETGFLLGCNYTPATAINPIAMFNADSFDPATIDAELALAADAGLNAMRVFTHLINWLTDGDAWLDRVDRFLDIAAARGHRVMLVPLDDCWGQDALPGEQPPPMPGVHNSGWVACPGHAIVQCPSRWKPVERYVRALVRRFARDSRVIGWDVYNEPGNGMRADHRPSAPSPLEKSLPLLRAVVEWVRSESPSQPLTVGVWNEEPAFAELNAFQLQASDVLSFHAYADGEGTRERLHRLRAGDPQRPIWCTEWLARGAGSTVSDVLPILAKESNGAFHWGLVDGLTQTKFPWQSAAYPAGDPPEPTPWHHELFHADHTPYDAAEIAHFRRVRRESGASKAST